MPPLDSLPHSLARSPQIETSDIGDRVVLYHSESGKSLVLNPLGTWLWRLMAAPMTTEDLAARVQAQYPTVDAESARRDVETYLYTLTEHGALQQN